MKIGCCVNMLAEAGDAVGMQYIPRLKELGYDYVELPLAQVMELDAGNSVRLEQILRKNDIRCECCNNFFPKSVRLTGPHTSIGEIEAYIESSLQKAAGFGAEIVVFGSSGAKNCPPDFSKAEAIKQVTDVLHSAARRAEKLGITIAIECLNRGESNLINNLSEGAELLESINNPQVKLLVDYYHFSLEKESIDTLKKNISNIIHVHIAHPDARLIPAGDCGCSQFIKQLQHFGYDGRISLEASFIYPEKELEEGLNWIRGQI